MIRVIFIGGLTNGKIVYEYLEKNEYTDLALAITYPDDCNKSNHVIFEDGNKLIKDNFANKYTAEIKKISPDYIIVAGWSELLSDELLSVANSGVIGFHPSKLPQDRGRSVLAWQIAEGYTETALTMFFYNDLPDCGDIIAQEKIAIAFEDTIKDILKKVDAATYNMMVAYYPLLRKGKIPRKEQPLNEGNFRRLRKDKDSCIDWNTNSEDIYNLVRAITKPYPGANAVINNECYKIWKLSIVDFPFGQSVQCGTQVCTLFDESFIVKTRNGFVHITEFEIME